MKDCSICIRRWNSIPTYDDAMQYLQLTYRRKADLECGDEAARKADMAKVDDVEPEGDGRS